MVDISGLERFKASLKQARQNVKPNKKNPKIDRIIDIAREEFTKAYENKFKVEVIVKENKSGYTIYVKDRTSKNPNKISPIIAFDEFGTGFYANGTYPGKLPTQRITFTSAGKKRSTNGWDYYYDNEDTKKEIGRVKGWFTPNGVFHIGQNANATMYRACKRVISRIRSELND